MDELKCRNDFMLLKGIDMNRRTLFGLLIVGFSAMAGVCNKEVDNGDGQTPGSSYVEPVFTADQSYFYMTGGSLPFFYGPQNNRPADRKWIASKITTALATHNLSDNNYNYLLLAFENNDKYTRFLTDQLNPGGKESMTISLNHFPRVPKVGTFTIDVDNKEGYLWYYVYDKNGVKHDSTRNPAIQPSTFIVTAANAVSTSQDGKYSVYKLSGTATLNIMYWQSGTSSTTDIHTLQMHFNNIPTTVEN
jgi:hypothetical protein